MPLVIDATVGGASSNSFVTLAGAQAYMDSRLNVDAWTGTATDETITVVAPGALTGATSVPVAPLPIALEIGDLITFGTAQVVVIAAAAAVDDQAITVETLLFDLLAGTEATVSGANTANQKIALVEATRELSAKLWVGSKSNTAQALAWPRIFATDPDISWSGTPYFASDIIPQRIKDATSELALQFLKGGTTDIASLDSTYNVKVKTVDVLTTEYFEPQQRAIGLNRYPSVMRFIAPLLEGSGLMVPIIRG